MERHRHPEGTAGADGIADEEFQFRPPPLGVVQLHGQSGLVGIGVHFGERVFHTAFGDQVRAIAPLLETEIKGAKMLNRTIGYLFVPEK
jgi:hypothetical protein